METSQRNTEKHMMGFHGASRAVRVADAVGPALIALGLGVTALVQFDSLSFVSSMSAASLTLSVLKGSLLAPSLPAKTPRMSNGFESMGAILAD